MDQITRMHPVPLRTPRTRRNHEIQVLTSLPAGRAVPVAAIPLLREDSMAGTMRIAVEMQETAELLMNRVELRATAFLVPYLALERFDGSRDQFDRSYMGQPKVDGGAVVPFFETVAAPAHGANLIHKYLGLHAKPGESINTAYTEVYNAIYNYRAKNRSKSLPMRERLLSTTLAPAFWSHAQFQHIVPDFDQAVIDGEVALNIVSQSIPVRGVGIGPNTGAGGAVGAGSGMAGIRETKGGTPTGTTGWYANSTGDNATVMIKADPANPGFPAVFAELQEGGITISLSNLEMARKTQAFAKLREQYEGIADEYIIDMLMDGLSIPDQAMKQPIMLAQSTVAFSQAKRYATDAGNLAESAVSGGAVVDLNVRVPRLSTGGIVMVILEAVPEQLFERQADWLLHTTTVATLPDYLRDELDPEKVDRVLNKQIDTDHATPNGTFGYEPMNARFSRAGTKVGGKFFRPAANSGTDTDRQRLWAVEDINPVLGENFYIVKNIHTKPFLDTVADPFEATIVGGAVLEGNTVFGGKLVEATNNYDKVMANAPQERLAK